jgi:PPM family protein phosphatase
MQCPNCNASVFFEDKFCQECGISLVNNLIDDAVGCAKCHAPPEAIDSEGNCCHCGFCNKPDSCGEKSGSERDRIEVLVSPILAGVSDKGRRHHENQDYLALRELSGNTYILVVCDGVSKSSSPELAAKTAGETVCQTLATVIEDGYTSIKAIDRAFAIAQQKLSHLPYQIENIAPSTTIVAAVIKDNVAAIGWLGDSRAYWVSPNESQQITKDDSLLEEILSLRKMSEAEAKNPRYAHAITRWLGTDTPSPKPSIVKFTLPTQGYLLLCTDGLWNYIPNPSDLEILIKPNIDILSVSHQLVDFANNSGGGDNITVAVFRKDV